MSSPPLRIARNQLNRNNESSRRQLFSDDNAGTISPNSTASSSLLKEIIENQKKLLEQNEKLLAAQQEQSRQAPSSSKIEVPTDVKAAVRNAYKKLDEEDIENFKGWNPEERFTSKQNQECTARLIEALQGWGYEEYGNRVLRAAAQINFRTRVTECRRVKNNTKEKHRNEQKLYQRKKRKLSQRIKVVNDSNLPADQERKYRSILNLDFMSSEESGESDGEYYMLKRSLPWRTESASNMLKGLDKKIAKKSSTRSKRMTLSRFMAEEPSSRPSPTSYPPWAVKNTE